MREDRYAAVLECRGTEDRFRAGMGKDRQQDWTRRDPVHGGDNGLALAIRTAGVHDHDAARPDDEDERGEAEYDQKDAEGFINLIGLPIRVRAQAAQAAKQGK